MHDKKTKIIEINGGSFEEFTYMNFNDLRNTIILYRNYVEDLQIGCPYLTCCNKNTQRIDSFNGVNYPPEDRNFVLNDDCEVYIDSNGYVTEVYIDI